jgi:hypothetical protein
MDKVEPVDPVLMEDWEEPLHLAVETLLQEVQAPLASSVVFQEAEVQEVKQLFLPLLEPTDWSLLNGSSQSQRKVITL